MDTIIRKWHRDDAEELAKILSNKNIHDNLRDGLPFPYTKKDAQAFIESMLRADSSSTFAFAIVDGNRVIGSIGVFRSEISIGVRLKLGIIFPKMIGARALLREP